jgi:conjugative transfer region lipoprotein (TIGR03751 family)
MRNKLLLIQFLSLSLVLGGCSSNYADESDEGKPTMLERHQSHVSQLYGNKIEQARAIYSAEQKSSSYTERYRFDDDLRLPNPELDMVVYPRRNSDGSIQPQHVVKFPMYMQVHYRTGRQ